ncbi:MAG: hypothetical protein IJX59_04730 [Clostridia bacterium]|nr:hypothetical protein [Clostridia bacterium]
MTKRIISLLLAALTAGSLVACTKGQKTTDEPDLPPRSQHLPFLQACRAVRQARLFQALLRTIRQIPLPSRRQI